MGKYLFKAEFNLTPPGEESIGRSGAQGIRVGLGQIVDGPQGDPVRWAHLVGECGPDCQMKGEHGWGVKDGLIEAVVDTAPEDAPVAPKRKRKGEEA